MKPEHEQYILENISRKPIEVIAKDLGLKERKIKRFLERQQSKEEMAASPEGAKTFLSKRKILLSMILIIVLGFAVYGNSLDGEFIWDDEHLIENNADVKDWSHVKYIFTTDIGAGAGREYKSYRPVQTITYMIDYAIWELDVRGYHLTNIVLHILAALSLYYLINLFFGDNRLSLLTAIFYVVHPIHTEAVTYISGRADALALFFMLLCFIFYIKRFSSKSAGLYFFMVFSYAMALLSRENSIMLPALVLLYHYSFKKKIAVKEFLSIIGLAFLYIFLRVIVLKALLSSGVVSTTTLSQRLPGFFVALVNYIKLLFFPFGLHMEYGSKLFPAGDPKVILGVLLFIVLLGCAFWRKKNSPLIFFCISWFFMALVPVSNLYPINAYMAEHWLYVPSIGFFLIIAKTILSLYETRGFKILTVIFVLGCLSFYSYLTIRQNIFWRKPLDFYRMTLRHAPNSARVHYNLGIAYFEDEKWENAMTAYEKAIELKPDYTDAYGNLGNVYKELKEYEKAIAFYKKILSMTPRDAIAYFNLGDVYRALNKPGEALEAYQKAIQFRPNYVGAYNGLGNVYAEMEKNDEAIGAYLKAIGYRPDYAVAHINLGNVFKNMNRYKEAASVYQKAIELDSDNAEPYNNLAIIYFRKKQYPLAIEHCDKAQKLGFVNNELIGSLEPYRK